LSTLKIFLHRVLTFGGRSGRIQAVVKRKEVNMLKDEYDEMDFDEFWEKRRKQTRALAEKIVAERAAQPKEEKKEKTAEEHQAEIEHSLYM
jgi:ribosomal protein L12E/L44/L45/RPP1/RPP2